MMWYKSMEDYNGEYGGILMKKILYKKRISESGMSE
jgi:hypothetical protein